MSHREIAEKRVLDLIKKCRKVVVLIMLESGWRHTFEITKEECKRNVLQCKISDLEQHFVYHKISSRPHVTGFILDK